LVRKKLFRNTSKLVPGMLVMLAKHTGMIDSWAAATADGTIYVTANGKRMVLDSQAKSLYPVD
jgi:hypothetical protein